MSIRFTYDDGPGKTVTGEDYFVLSNDQTNVDWTGLKETEPEIFKVMSFDANDSIRALTLVLQREGDDNRAPATIRETMTRTEGESVLPDAVDDVADFGVFELFFVGVAVRRISGDERDRRILCRDHFLGDYAGAGSPRSDRPPDVRSPRCERWVVWIRRGEACRSRHQYEGDAVGSCEAASHRSSGGNGFGTPGCRDCADALATAFVRSLSKLLSALS